MKVIDPGHIYELAALDKESTTKPLYLKFVKRMGKLYPGNKSKYSGTTTQDVLRACCDRLRYVNNQLPSSETQRALFHLRSAILELENRAASRHNRKQLIELDQAEFGDCCTKCNHVGCVGKCH